MIPRLKPTLGIAELRAAWRPGRSDDVANFEQAFAALMGQRHAVAFPYGRTGLMFLLEALGLREREVICPAYTCVVVPHSIVFSGNEPVFIDCTAGGFNMDLEQAEANITERTGALIATSLFGYPVDLDRLDALRRRHPNVVVIQDCAHSFAAEWGSRPVQRDGAAAVFGLNISKLITSIFGGMITTDDGSLAARLFQLRQRRQQPAGILKGWRRRLYLSAAYVAFLPVIYGLTNRLERLDVLDRFVRYYDDARIDMPLDHLQAMTTVEASVGLRQLERYRTIVAHRRRIAALYHQLLEDAPGLVLPPLVEGATYSHYVPLATRREAILEYALKQGVQLGRLIEYSIPEMAAYRNRSGVRSDYPVAAKLASTSLNLPVHVDRCDAQRVAGVLRDAML